MGNHPSLTVVFAMLSEVGHYAGTFRLARQLSRRGHRILYLGIPDFRGLVEAQGFGFIPFAAEVFPVGYLREFAAAQSAPQRSLLDRLRRRVADEALFAAFLRQIEEGPLDDCLRSCNPHIVLCDTFVWYVALRALRLGVPVVNVSIVLSLHPNAAIAPITTAIRPRSSWWSRPFIRGSWAWLRVRFFFTKGLASLVLGRYRFPTRMHHLVGVFRRVARRSGYVLRGNRTWWHGEMGPRLALPEIVLCPRAFQLPGGPEESRVYLGDCVDVDRREEPLGAGSIDEAKPLVYCSLGSSPFLYPHAGRFFGAVIAASRSRPEWQFVLHVGDFPAASVLDPPPPNLLRRARVPQLALLARASVMVTHGGLNSIMECIRYGVPMVIVPAMRDQPGNAVRAVHHRIGLMARMSAITPERLLALIDRAASDGDLRRSLTRLRREVEAEGGSEAAVRLIESAAARRS